MDLLTQGLLGAALAQSAAKKQEMRRASVIGFLSGLLADADVVIQSASDPLLTLEYHRHFSHSIFFIPLGALLAAIILWPLFRRNMNFGRLYVFSLLGYSLSGFIDACTSYGTYLLWPLYNERIAFAIISIVDPVFTLTLFIAALLAFMKYRANFTRVGLAICATYLMLGVMQSHRAESSAHELADTRGHTIDKIVVKPTLGNLLLWRSTYISGDSIHVDAIRAGLFKPPKIYAGSSLPLFKAQRDMPGTPMDSILMHDVTRFSHLADGYVALHPLQADVLSDLRYSMLPNSIYPLWALRLNRDSPQLHAKYEFYRTIDVDLRKQLIDMLLGN